MIGCVMNVEEMREGRVFGMNAFMRNHDGRERPASLSVATMRQQDRQAAAARELCRAEMRKRDERPQVRRRAKVA